MRNVRRILGAITFALVVTVISDDASSKIVSEVPRQPMQNMLTQNASLIDIKRRADRNETNLDTRAVVAFDSFAVKVKLKEEELDVGGVFALGSASDGINLFKEEVAVKLGTLATTIKAGSFKRKTSGKVGFKKVIDCTYWELEFRPLGNNNFEFKADLLGIKGTTNVRPEDVVLAIGDDSGTARAQ